MQLKNKKIGFDLDGVLAAFDPMYHAQLRKRCGKPDVGFSPDKWDWEEEAGVTKAAKRDFWNMACHPQHGYEFWARMPMLASPEEIQKIIKLTYDNMVYFITKRSLSTRLGTYDWLVSRGIVASNAAVRPNICIIHAEDKVEVIKGLHLDAFLEDKGETVDRLVTEVPKGKWFLRDQPWNQSYNHLRVKSVGEYIQRLEDV